jgi:hypothetical protein
MRAANISQPLSAEKRLKELGITLPPPAEPFGNAFKKSEFRLKFHE